MARLSCARDETLICFLFAAASLVGSGPASAAPRGEVVSWNGHVLSVWKVGSRAPRLLYKTVELRPALYYGVQARLSPSGRFLGMLTGTEKDARLCMFDLWHRKLRYLPKTPNLYRWEFGRRDNQLLCVTQSKLGSFGECLNVAQSGTSVQLLGSGDTFDWSRDAGSIVISKMSNSKVRSFWEYRSGRVRPISEATAKKGLGALFGAFRRYPEISLKTPRTWSSPIYSNAGKSA